MNCCATCFGDRGLRNNIIPLLSTEIGKCSYCESDQIPIVNPAALSDYLELLISAYKTDAEGKLLVEWFRTDWGMFDHSRMDDPRAKDLLAEILNDGEIVRERFEPAYPAETNRLLQWETLREELMWRNRFFPEANIDYDRLEVLLFELIVGEGEVPRTWHRARIQTGELPLAITEMGAPPRKSSSHGRANPAGIPYLYLAANPETAISEIRPHTGDVACVADFTTPEGLKLVDLRSPRKMVSPFLLMDGVEICRMRNDLPFLERLGFELTRPVVPQSAAIDYTPSQYLCEFIKHCKFDGVVYRSSVSEGVNLALFDPAVAISGIVTQYRIGRVSVQVLPFHP